MTRSAILMIALIFLLGAAACTPPTAPTPPTPPTSWAAPLPPAAPEGADKNDDLEMRSYTVAQGQQSRVASMLRSLSIGQVSQGPGDRLVVVASPRMQQSVAAFIEELAKDKAAERPPASLAFDYWLVLGTAPAGEQGATTIPEIGPALEAISSVEGPMEFVKVEKLRVLSIDSEDATAEGRWASVTHRASTAEGSILAEVKVKGPGGIAFRTIVRVDPEKFVVLGQVGFDPSLAKELIPLDGQPRDHKLFVVLRASIDP